MKVITLTADQKTKLAALAADRRATAGAAGIAQKAFTDYVATLAGGPISSLTRAEVSDDGNSLVVG